MQTDHIGELRAKRDRLASERKSVEGQLRASQEAVRTADSEIAERGVAAALDPSPAADAALAAARAAREAAVAAMDAAEEKLEFIGTAEHRVREELRQLEQGATSARVEAATAALTARVESSGTALAEILIDLFALQHIRCPVPVWKEVEHADVTLARLLKSAGHTLESVVSRGKDLAHRIAAGEEV